MNELQLCSKGQISGTTLSNKGKLQADIILFEIICIKVKNINSYKFMNMKYKNLQKRTMKGSGKEGIHTFY